MATHHYIYLTREEWVDPWERGGPIPINPASTYLSDIRQGTQTPDETQQRSSQGIPEGVVGGREASASPVQLLSGNLIMENVGIVGWGRPPAYVAHGAAESRFEDGLILCLSTRLDGEVAQRLGKVACVRIQSMPQLIAALDDQIGVKSQCGPVEYRDGFARNHFLKAAADQWQQEYRLLWITDDVGPRTVELPAGIASRVYW